MRKNRITAVLVGAVMCMSCSFSVSAAEADYTGVEITSEETPAPRAEGLILSRSLSCTAGTKTVYITASTVGTAEMGKIGFCDVVVQRSSNRTDWTTEVELGDLVISDAYSHSLSRYPVTVSGGYYYRVSLTHYAKEDTWFFPDVQTSPATSLTVWVS